MRWRRIFALGFGLLMATALLERAGAVAGEPNGQAFLRLDAGQHTARIARIATDRNETIAVTASDDKTLRVWSVADGSLLSVLRVPLDDGWEGKLYAVAVSPDGRTALAAGNTGSTWDDGQVSLYLFDLEKQAIRTRLPGQPAVITSVAYSPDGRFVAIGYGAKIGVRIWDSEKFRLIVEDRKYDGFVSGLSFDDRGRLAVVASDGAIRLYNPETFTLASRANLSGKQPTSVALTADGARIAVGYADKRSIDVLSGKDLKPMTAPSLDGIDKGTAGTVAWVARADGGGQDLIAGGTLTKGPGQYVVRRWANGGRPQDVVLAGDTITHLAALSKGGYLFSSGDPSWGRVDGKDAVAFTQARVTADFRDAHEGRLALSPNGLTVLYRPERDAGAYYRFNLQEHVLSRVDGGALPPAEAGGDLAGRPDVKPTPEADAKALKLTNWRNAADPKLKNLPLTLEPGDQARSLAALPDGKRFVLGTDISLRLYDEAGRVLQQVQLPGAAWSLVAAKAAPFVVAALGDGSLRWYNTGPDRTPLEEVAAYFPHRDGRRWVLWTPEGFFDYAQDGGSEFVGFHLNEGKRNTRWMEFERAYRVFYSSDIVTAKLDPANDRMIQERLAKIGDLRQLMIRRPDVRLIEYCLDAEPAKRGLQRVDNGPTATVVAAPTPIASAPESAASSAAPSPSCTAAGALATRGLARRDAADATSSPTGSAVLPADTQRVRIRFATKGDGGHGAIRIFRNGRNASEERVTRGLSRVDAAPATTSVTTPTAGAGIEAAPSGEEIHEGTVFLDTGENRIEIRVFDKTDAAYASQTLVLVKPEPPAPEPAQARRILALVAGVNAYQGAVRPLTFARTDAQNFAKLIKDHIPPPFDPAQSKIVEIYDSAASKQAIKSGLSTLQKEARPGDLVVVYLAGHGDKRALASSDSQESYYYIPADTVSVTDEAIRSSGLSGDELVDGLSNLRTRDVLLILDTCHAGQFAKGVIERIKKEIGKPNIWAASASVQEALDEYPGTGHGLFFHAIATGMSRDVPSMDNELVPLRGIGSYLETQIPRMAKRLNQKQSATILQPSLEDGEESIPLVRRAP